MKYLALHCKDLPVLFKTIREKHRIVAPVRKENQFIFAEVHDSAEMALDYIPTILPPKKYFLPQHEDLVQFQFGKIQASPVESDTKSTVIFGMHTCDIAAIACLETVFHNDPFDSFFCNREKSLIIIGYECLKPCDDKATCLTMDTHLPRGFYDLMITASKEQYILQINSDAGFQLIKDSGLWNEELTKQEETLKNELNTIREQKRAHFTTPLKPTFHQLYQLFDHSYDSPVWEEVGAKCLSCGNCTMVCPTCYCFDIYDELDLKLNEGTRRRVWDSCQLHDFALVASGENFREKRESRQRHRFFRKFSYPVKKYNKYFCIGCGRCTRTCMAKISLIETVNSLAKEYDNAKR